RLLSPTLSIYPEPPRRGKPPSTPTPSCVTSVFLLHCFFCRARIFVKCRARTTDTNGEAISVRDGARLRPPGAGGPRGRSRRGDSPMSRGWVGLAATVLGLLSGAPSDDVVHINQQRFTIPIRVVPERQHEVRELLLFMSRDKGQTWEVYARATP